MASTQPREVQLADILKLLQQYKIVIDDSQIIALRNIIDKHNDDRDNFISQMLNARHHIEDNPETVALPSDILDVILYRFIKLTELNTTNIITVASIIINDLGTADELDIDEVYDVFMQNNICGRTFVRGTDEHINAAKFCKLFKSVSNWKQNKSVFRKMWVRFNKWEETEIQGVDVGSESDLGVTSTLLNKKTVCSVQYIQVSCILKNYL